VYDLSVLCREVIMQAPRVSQLDLRQDLPRVCQCCTMRNRNDNVISSSGLLNIVNNSSELNVMT
jgi:hypothetical protein